MSCPVTPAAPTIRTCWLPERAHQEVIAQARTWEPLEVGGVLAGYWKGDVAVVTDLIGPGQNATHGRADFFPDHQFHEAEIARLYTASGGTTVYLGDWHSHPLGLASLSAIDERTLRAIGSASEARCSRPLMLLVAGSNDAWSIRVFTLGPARRLLPRNVISAELRFF